jgi:hypothetical protein
MLHRIGAGQGTLTPGLILGKVVILRLPER